MANLQRKNSLLMTFHSDSCQMAKFYFANHEMDNPLWFWNFEIEQNEFVIFQHKEFTFHSYSFSMVVIFSINLWSLLCVRMLWGVYKVDLIALKILNEDETRMLYFILHSFYYPFRISVFFWDAAIFSLLIEFSLNFYFCADDRKVR